jgi:3-oxoacyl-[acyl-carrier-protein] synthase II
MTKADNDVVITGVGIVTSLGVGKAPHVAVLTAKQTPVPVVDGERLKPYPVHPLPEIDWSEQIPKRGDQRQMENWQRTGVFAAGLALADAGLKDDAEACGTMDMIVSAGGGERDINVDTLIADEALKRNDRDVLLNEKLTTELRPTLFLAQLSNLLAGNISIVHKVTGSSRTFMGEEGAGISAVETAFARIKAGQSTHSLVGGAFVAERADALLLVESIRGLVAGDWTPLWSREGEDGGMIYGSVGAFLVLESRAHANARGAHVYASLDGIEGDRGSRDDGKFEARLGRLLDDTTAGVSAANGVIFSGATGFPSLSSRELTVLGDKLPDVPVRGYGGLFGHSIEVQFPLGLALAALALDEKAAVPAFDPDHEAGMTAPATKAVVTTVGHVRGEGAALLSANA